MNIGFSQVRKDTIKVYFLAGQSNMQGYGFNKDLPNELKNKFENVFIFQGNNVEDNKPNAGLGVWDNLQAGHGTDFSSDGKTNKLSDRFGIELSFANELIKNNNNEKIALIKYSRNGSSIDLEGAPYFGTWSQTKKLETDKNQYDYFLETVKNAMAIKDINNDGVEDVLVPGGIIWMQGESDANSKAVADKYYKNLKQLMTAMRTLFKNNYMPVVVGLISDSGNDADGKVWDFGKTVQQSQIKFVRKHKNTAIVTTTLNYKYSDKYHYDSLGYIDLGIQFANKIYALSRNY